MLRLRQQLHQNGILVLFMLIGGLSAAGKAPEEVENRHPAGYYAEGIICDDGGSELGNQAITWVKRGDKCPACVIPVPGVKVRLVNARGEAVVAITDDTGYYKLPYLNVSGDNKDVLYWDMGGGGISIRHIGRDDLKGYMVCVVVTGLADHVMEH
jgi:hypothetical protein